MNRILASRTRVPKTALSWFTSFNLSRYNVFFFSAWIIFSGFSMIMCGLGLYCDDDYGPFLDVGFS